MCAYVLWVLQLSDLSCMFGSVTHNTWATPPPVPPMTAAWQQHDVQELCRVLFDALEANLRGTNRVCASQAVRQQVAGS